MNKCLLMAPLVLALANTANAQPNDTLGKIKASGEVVLGVREAGGGLSYALGDGKYGGFHVEVCQNIVAALEKSLDKKLQTKYQPVTSQNRIPSVSNGTVDLECGVTTNNATRQKDVSFVLTTFVEEVRMAVRANSGINSIAQLNGKTLASTAGTTSLSLIRRQKNAASLDIKEILAKDDAETFALLEGGKADAYVMDSQILAGAIANTEKPSDFKIVGAPLAVEPIAIMIRKDDPAFKKIADDTVRALVKSGQLPKIYAKWFVQPIPPKNIKLNLPASNNTKAAWANLNDKPAEEYVAK